MIFAVNGQLYEFRMCFVKISASVCVCVWVCVCVCRE